MNVLKLKEGDTISWRVESAEERQQRVEADTVGSVTMKGPNSMEIEVPIREKMIVRDLIYRTNNALNFVGVKFDVVDGDGEKLADFKKTLSSYGVEDGDELSWQLRDGMEPITVKIVSEKNASEVRTVTLGKYAKIGGLNSYLFSASKERGLYTFVSNGCTVSSNAEKRESSLREALKLKEGDTILWRIEQMVQKRYREADEDTEMSSPPKKRQRRE